jgi:hypothetical protein
MGCLENSKSRSSQVWGLGIAGKKIPSKSWRRKKERKIIIMPAPITWGMERQLWNSGLPQNYQQSRDLRVEKRRGMLIWLASADLLDPMRDYIKRKEEKKKKQEAVGIYLLSCVYVLLSEKGTIALIICVADLSLLGRRYPTLLT